MTFISKIFLLPFTFFHLFIHFFNKKTSKVWQYAQLLCQPSMASLTTTEFFSLTSSHFPSKDLFSCGMSSSYLFIIYEISRCIMNPENIFLCYSHVCAQKSSGWSQFYCQRGKKVCSFKNPENEFAKVRCEDNKKWNGSFEGDLDGKLKKSVV